MQVLRREFAARGIHQVDRRVRLADIASFPSMFLTNSWGIAPVNRVDDIDVPISYEFMEVLSAAYDGTRWDEV
jgi:branched-subunit amino acid aminotransferase/4-amino-4-deoxychorismate lyase